MSIFVDKSKRRKWYVRAGGVSVVTLVLLVCGFFVLNIFLVNAQHHPLPHSFATKSYHYYYSPASEKKIALTIDDGPNHTTTRAMLDTLEKHNVPATFFFIGSKVLQHPELVQETHKRGFAIGNHSFTHDRGAHSTRERLSLELRSSSHAIYQATGEKPLLYRPPFLLGIGIDPTLNPYVPVPEDVAWILDEGYLPVGSDIDPYDWKASSKEGVLEGIKTAFSEADNKHIVLLHETPQTTAALEETILLLKQQGYTFVSLEELLFPPHIPSLSQTLTYGDTDATTKGEVSALQWFLYTQGFLNVSDVTGTFTTETQRAVESFQLSRGTTPRAESSPTLGRVDADTRALIQHDTLRQATEITLPTAPTLGASVYTALSSFGRDMFVNVVPFFRTVFGVLVGVTFFLVILRITMIGGILLWSWRFKKDTSHSSLYSSRGVSILIPAYNEEENIRATIESALRSTHKKKEIIVIDDGSTDATAEIVESMLSEESSGSLRLLRKPNGGKADALNVGLEAARYDIIVVLDADAVLDAEALRFFVPHFKDPLIGAVAGHVRTTNNKSLLDMCQTIEYAVGQHIEKRAFSYLNAVGIVPGPAGAWNKKYLKEVGGFSTDTLVEDQDMTLSILRIGKKIVYESRAISYTETPHTLKNFMKQRFRWIYGTLQCFWKHRGAFVEKRARSMRYIVLPNILVFSIILPLTYPLADIAIIAGILTGELYGIVLPLVLIILFDVAYACLGMWNEPQKSKALWAVPLQRFFYRQLICYVVIKSVIRALEGTGSNWNKFKKSGETQRFYTALMECRPYSHVLPETVSISVHGPSGTSFRSTNLHSTTPIPPLERQSRSAGEISIPA